MKNSKSYHSLYVAVLTVAAFRYSINKGVLENFTKFTVKHLC